MQEGKGECYELGNVYYIWDLWTTCIYAHNSAYRFDYWPTRSGGRRLCSAAAAINCLRRIHLGNTAAAAVLEGELADDPFQLLVADRRWKDGGVNELERK